MGGPATLPVWLGTFWIPFPTSVCPMLKEHRIANAADIDAKTLPRTGWRRNRADLGSVAIGWSEVGAWARLAMSGRHGYCRAGRHSTDFTPIRQKQHWRKDLAPILIVYSDTHSGNGNFHIG